MIALEEWLDNRSIGPSGVKIIVIISALLGIVGTIAGFWLIIHNQFKAGIWLVALSSILGFGFAYGFGHDIKSMKYFTRQMSYFCRDNPRPYDQIFNFIGDFLARKKIEYHLSETSSGATFSSVQQGLRATIFKDGPNVILFGINDIHGNRGDILDSFKIEAIKVLNLRGNTETLSVTSLPVMAFASQGEHNPLDETKLLLEEPIDNYNKRMRPVGIVGKIIIVLGIVWLGFGIAGKIIYLGLEGLCLTSFIAVGGGLIGGGWVIMRTPSLSCPVRIYEEGMLESFPPQKRWSDPKTKFYRFKNLKCVKNSHLPSLPRYEFRFENPSRSIFLDKNIPGMDKIIEHISKNFPHIPFL